MCLDCDNKLPLTYRDLYDTVYFSKNKKESTIRLIKQNRCLRHQKILLDKLSVMIDTQSILENNKITLSTQHAQYSQLIKIGMKKKGREITHSILKHTYRPLEGRMFKVFERKILEEQSKILEE